MTGQPVRPPRRRGPYFEIGVARVRKPVSAGKLYLARFVDVDGKVRQCGRFKTLKEAKDATKQAVDERNSGHGVAGARQAVPTLRTFVDEEWLQTFPRHPTTESTLLERVRRVTRHLPAQGEIAIDALRRPHMVAAQDALLRRGLAKGTIDNSFSALSQLLRDAQELEYTDRDVAAGMKVRPTDPRLNRNPRSAEHRALGFEEFYAFIDCVPAEHRPRAWAAAVSGARPGELFAANARFVDRRRGLIFLHQTVSENGVLMDGLKGSHHVADLNKRGRFTLWPQTLAAMFDEVGVHPGGWLVPSPTGRLWSLNNFYAAPDKRPSSWWKRAIRVAGVEPFTLYDLRHSFSSWLQAVPIPAVEVSAWMGHSLREGGVRVDTTTARFYTHGTGQWREAAHEALEAIMARRAPAQRRPAPAIWQEVR